MIGFRNGIAVTGQSAEQPVAFSLGTAAAALGRYDDAEGLFTEAIEISRRAGAPTYVAVTELAWAEALVARAAPGDREQAHELATQSLATAEALGLGRVAELSRRVLSAR